MKVWKWRTQGWLVNQFPSLDPFGDEHAELARRIWLFLGASVSFVEGDRESGESSLRKQKSKE